MGKLTQGVLILSGMIIGAGMFGIPFSFVSLGFWPGAIELLILTIVTVVLHLIYGEIVLKTSTLHRLPGYIKIHLGEKWSILAWIGAFVIFFPLKKEAFLNGILTFVLIVFIVFLVAILFPKVDPVNLGSFNFSKIFVPYGVLLFALSGGIVIPDLVTILGRERKLARYAILIGTLIPALLYFFFAYAVVGSLGLRVSEEAIGGLGAIIGENVIILGSTIGFLAVFTSFVALGSSAKALFQLDFGLKKNFSWALVSFLPFIFYVLGFKNFIVIIGALGALVGGVDAGLIIGAYHRVKLKEGRGASFFSYFWKLLIYLMIAAGVFY